jgi:hypothetical protein
MSELAILAVAVVAWAIVARVTAHRERMARIRRAELGDVLEDPLGVYTAEELALAMRAVAQRLAPPGADLDLVETVLERTARELDAGELVVIVEAESPDR